MDPFSVLGLDAGVSEPELAAAYRREARRWHPDRPGGDAARMARVNEAYEQAREEVRRSLRRVAAEVPVRRRPPAGHWLPQALRRRLGRELLAALGEGEPVRLVTEAGRSGAGPARLVLTDRRLLWVTQDAVAGRVDWVRFGIVEAAEERRGRLGGRRAALRVRTATGRRLSFGDLEPAAAGAIAQALGARRAVT